MSHDATVEMFFEEAADLVADSEAALLRLEQASSEPDPGLVNRIFRNVHTLKGTSAMLGFERLAGFAHSLEDVLARMRKGEQAITPPLVDTLLASVDVFRRLLERAREGSAGEPEDLEATLAGLRALTAGTAARADGNGAGTLAAGGARLFRQASDEADGHDPDHASEATTVRVPIEKVDGLVNLVGELVITQSMIARLVAHLGPDRGGDLEEAVAQMDRHARELQERVMAVRMLPIRTVFRRFPRLVRDLAHAEGKQVVLEASGEDTELDKGVIEQITDPLTHLLRNAIDHGIETPDARRLAGKPDVSRLRLRAYQEGGNIHLEVADDGRGLDRDKIAWKAVAIGLLTPDARPTDDEIFGLIFRPGFTTAETVTHVSGRGVGLDVVRRNIETLGGSITVHTEPGRGTTFHIRLPLTLAILDGQSLRVGSHSYILPLASIVESMRPRPGQVRRVFTDAEVVVIRDRALPMIRLHRLFGIVPAVEDPAQGIVVIVEHGGRDVALLVDELGGQQQVVIKSLEANFTKIAGMAGATILSDGGVALILDVPGLVALSHARPGREARLGASDPVVSMARSADESQLERGGQR
jgi:two-component system chemotaxis sensor kinase CheA